MTVVQRFGLPGAAGTTAGSAGGRTVQKSTVYGPRPHRVNEGIQSMMISCTRHLRDRYPRLPPGSGIDWFSSQGRKPVS